MRRLFSTFASGWPGAGLLIMRLVAGLTAITQGLMTFRSSPTVQVIILEVFVIAVGILLVAGLWTPISASLLVILAVWNMFVQRGDLWANILLATLGGALALLGPGAWSVDSRLFGWKRIDLDRKN